MLDTVCIIGNDKFNNYSTRLKTISACSALIAFTYDKGGLETIFFYWTMEMHFLIFEQ